MLCFCFVKSILGMEEMAVKLAVSCKVESYSRPHLLEALQLESNLLCDFVEKVEDLLEHTRGSPPWPLHVQQTPRAYFGIRLPHIYFLREDFVLIPQK